MEQSRTDRGEPPGNPLTGILILVFSFFTMPIKTLQLTAVELRELGTKGKLEVDATNIPHLTWLQMAAHLTTSVVVILIVTIGVFGAFTAFLAELFSPYPVWLPSLFTRLIFGIAASLLTAVAANWLIATGFEILTLMTGVANDIRRMSAPDGR